MAADMDQHVNQGKLLEVVECNCHKCMAAKPVSVRRNRPIVTILRGGNHCDCEAEPAAYLADGPVFVHRDRPPLAQAHSARVSLLRSSRRLKSLVRCKKVEIDATSFQDPAMAGLVSMQCGCNISKSARKLSREASLQEPTRTKRLPGSSCAVLGGPRAC
jgi:hypothetical protein